MEKKLYYEITDMMDESKIIMDLPGCMTWIEEDLKGVPPEDIAEFQYTITPIYLTDKEYKNLPKAEN